MVAAVTLIVITVGAAGSMYALLGETMSEPADTTERIKLNMDSMEPETCYWENNNTKVVVRNTMDETINASKIKLVINGRLKDGEEYSVDPAIVDPQSTFKMNIDALIGRGTQLEMSTADQDMNHICSRLEPTNLYETSYEFNDEGWGPYTTGRDITIATTDATDEKSIGEESMKAGRSNGVGGYGGMAKTFNTDYDILELDFKAKADDWGRTSIIIKNENTGNHETIWRRLASGDSYETGWQTKTFDISDKPANFTVIIGNDDDSSTSDNYDHGWRIWADDVELAKKE